MILPSSLHSEPEYKPYKRLRIHGSPFLLVSNLVKLRPRKVPHDSSRAFCDAAKLFLAFK